ncbi:UNVERIFIED_CONTAM: hypothetical protein PYX00_011629 [Menopon gallinae]|uniref:Ubiquitin n=1 Tax=Menopon gallinae TaxID=328185 RepID=A0AAW2H872_9NEOP
MKTLETRYPVDSLLVDDNVVAGCYSYENGLRRGEVVMLDMASGDMLFSAATSGTFNIARHKSTIFAANASDVAVMSSETLSVMKVCRTESMNTDICVASAVMSTTSDGRVIVFDGMLRMQSEYKVSDEILWCLSAEENVAYAGGDDGRVHRVDMRLGKGHPVAEKKGVVTMLHLGGNLLYVGTSGGAVEAYDIRTYGVVLRKDIGSTWRMRVGGGNICLACVHDGVKVLDLSWNAVRDINPQSMVYAAEITGDHVIFSSFYEKKIFVDCICGKPVQETKKQKVSTLKQMKITFQTTSGEKHSLEVDDEMTVGDAKKRVEEMMKEENRVAAQDQRYIFAGKILEDGEKFKSIENLKDGSCVFLMGKSRAKAAEKKEREGGASRPGPQPQQPSYNAGVGYPQGSPNMGGRNDFIGAGIQQSFEYLSNNPEVIDMMYGHLMANMNEEQKENLRRTILSQIKEFQRNPKAFQQAMDYAQNINPGAFNQMAGAMPMGQGSFPHAQPQYQPPYGSPGPIPCSHGYYPPYFAGMPHYSPYQIPPQHPAPSPISDSRLREIHAKNANHLLEMGFDNDELNFEALKSTNGDVNSAIDLLIKWMENKKP